MLSSVSFVAVFFTVFLLAFSQAQFDLSRTFIVAGQFDKGVGASGEKTDLHSVGLFSGEEWGAIGDAAPNGPIYATEYVTICNRLYIAGAFSAIGDKNTGNVAYYDLSNNEWNAVGQESDWAPESYVSSLSVDCSNAGICECHVAVGGNFSMTSGNGNNVAFWDAGDEKWDTLKGGMENPVYAVKHSRSRIFAGSDNTLKYYDLDDEEWKTPFSDSINGAVRALTINENTFSKDKMYFGGDFSEPCLGICSFEPTGDTDPKQLADGLKGTVHSISYEDEDVYAAGDFSQNSVRNVAKLTEGEIAWTRIHSSDFKVFDEPINTMWVCQASSIGCKRGSIMVGASDYNSLSWFNTREPEEGWTLVGGGVSGPVFAIDSTSRPINGAASLGVSTTIGALFVALCLFWM